MDGRWLKLYVLLMFGASIAFAFFLPAGKARAGSDEKSEAKAEILKRLATYRSWKQVNKPRNNTLSDAFLIANSSTAG